MIEFFSSYGLYGLFIISFLAATLLPLGSEALLVSLLVAGVDPLVVVVIASSGNVLGSVVNYLLGFYGGEALAQRFLGMSKHACCTAQKHISRYGLLALLFAWMPIVGDPITLVAGLLRIRFWWFFGLVSLGKIFRYSVICYITLSI